MGSAGECLQEREARSRGVKECSSMLLYNARDEEVQI